MVSSWLGQVSNPLFSLQPRGQPLGPLPCHLLEPSGERSRSCPETAFIVSRSALTVLAVMKMLLSYLCKEGIEPLCIQGGKVGGGKQQSPSTNIHRSLARANLELFVAKQAKQIQTETESERDKKRLTIWSVFFSCGSLPFLAGGCFFLQAIFCPAQCQKRVAKEDWRKKGLSPSCLLYSDGGGKAVYERSQEGFVVFPIIIGNVLQVSGVVALSARSPEVYGVISDFSSL